MAATSPNPSDLSAADRRALEAWLAGFERSWHEGRLAERLRGLSELPAALRRPALLGAVKIDLGRWWERGRRVVVEDYLRDVPELGTPDTVPVELVRFELELRERFGAPADPEDVARRFPGLAGELFPPGPAAGPTRGATLAETKRTRGQPPPTRETAAPPPPKKATRGARGGAGDLPERFGRYRVLRRLGQGGMGSVFLAHDPPFDRQVALKVPHFSTADGPELVERFYREARAAAALRHPNFCPVYDVGEVDGVLYLTMAYIEGRSLDRVLAAEGAQPPPRAAGLVRTLALALEEAHGRGIIHRDLKPSNIVIDARGEPVILDFGLALKGGPDDARLTRDGAMMGTPAYMPPEQVSGDVRAMGPGCDVYSLGVILYELLTGRLPFEGPTAGVLAQILVAEPPRPSKHRPGLDARLESVCLRAMAKKVRDRYSSMRAMADALAETAERGAPGAEREPPRPRRDPPVEKSGDRGKTLRRSALRTETPERRAPTVAPRAAPPPAGTPAAPGKAAAPRPAEGAGVPGWALAVAGVAGLAAVTCLLIFLVSREERPARPSADRVSAVAQTAPADPPKADAAAAKPATPDGPKQTASAPAAVPVKAAPEPPAVRIADNPPPPDAEKPPPKPAGPDDGLASEARNMIRSLTDKDVEVRRTVAGAMAKLRPPHAAVIAALCNALSDRDALVRRSAAYSLCELGDKAAVPALIERVADDNWGATWGRPGEPPFGAFLDAYDDIANGVNQGSKPAALAALLFLDAKRADEALDKAEQSENASVRTWAAQRKAERRRARGDTATLTTAREGGGGVQGIWVVRTAELEGKPLDLSKYGFLVRIDAATVVWSLPDPVWMPVSYRLGEAGGLRTIDTTPLTKPNGMVSHGIYRREGDTLTLCFAASPELPRPAGFRSEQSVLFVLDRFKP